MAENKIADWWA